jgi:S-adenosylmethionine decarboxylase proenzyme
MESTKPMRKLGKQILAEYYGCDKQILGSKEAIDRLLNDAINLSGANVISSTSNTFLSFGISVVYVIAESHVSIHTWPEHRYAAVDIFTCGGRVNPWIIQRHLKAALKSETVSAIEIHRGVLETGGGADHRNAIEHQ